MSENTRNRINIALIALLFISFISISPIIYELGEEFGRAIGIHFSDKCD
jgi:hypothetical protein